MFKRIFVVRLKYLFRSKEFIFWILCFPIILTSLFKVAFSNMMSSEKFDVIDIVYCQEENATYEYKDMFKTVMEQMSKESDDQIFNMTIADDSKATQMLEDGDAAVYVKVSDEPHMIVIENGISQTIAKETLDIIVKRISLGGEIYMSTGKMPEDIGNEAKAYIEQKNEQRNEPDTSASYFYAAIAMTCMFGALLGVFEIINIQADLSPVATRNSLSPVSKWTQFLAGFAASSVVMIALLAVVLFYIQLVLQINFGDRRGYIVLTTVIGGITGVSIGMAISAITKKGENFKVGLVTAVSILCSFFSGLMISDMKYIIHKNIPVLDIINPASRVTDSYYRLYYYDNLDGFWQNIIVMLIMIVVSLSITALAIRRQRYDSV